MAMAAVRAPKQKQLTEDETITSFESWRQNLRYVLSLDPSFTDFLAEGTQWAPQSRRDPLRGFVDDGDDVAIRVRRTARQKVIALEMMLGQIANWCTIISRDTIVKHSTCLSDVWQAIRTHFNFQTSGAHFLDFADIVLKPGEKPETLYQRILAFVEDNLLTVESGIEHRGEEPAEDEEICSQWLKT